MKNWYLKNQKAIVNWKDDDDEDEDSTRWIDENQTYGGAVDWI